MGWGSNKKNVQRIYFTSSNNAYTTGEWTRLRRERRGCLNFRQSPSDLPKVKGVDESGCDLTFRQSPTPTPAADHQHQQLEAQPARWVWINSFFVPFTDFRKVYWLDMAFDSSWSTFLNSCLSIISLQVSRCPPGCRRVSAHPRPVAPRFVAEFPHLLADILRQPLLLAEHLKFLGLLPRLVVAVATMTLNWLHHNLNRLIFGQHTSSNSNYLHLSVSPEPVVICFWLGFLSYY